MPLISIFPIITLLERALRRSGRFDTMTLLMADLDELKRTAEELDTTESASRILSALIVSSAIRDAADFLGKSIKEIGGKYIQAATQKK